MPEAEPALEPEPAPAPDPEPDAGTLLAPEPAPAPEPQRYLEPEPYLEPDDTLVTHALPISPTGAYRPGAAFAAAASDPGTTPAGPPVWRQTGPSDQPRDERAATAPRWADAQAAAARWENAVADPGPTATVAAGGATAPTMPTASRLSMPALPLLVLERGVALATVVIAVTFLLPWGDLMIGAAVAGDPWQTLGIVGSWHWLAWLLALPVIVLASSAPAVPTWLRLGVLPITYAGLVTGVAWPYVLGPIGGAPAPMVLVFASVALVALGALAVRPGGLEEPEWLS